MRRYGRRRGAARRLQRPSVGPECESDLWLTDRSLVRDMLGNYDSLPDTYTLADYRHEVAGHDVRGIVWSDAGADDPIAAAAWVQRQCDELDVSGAPGGDARGDG